MLDPADLPPDDILDYVAIDTDNAGHCGSGLLREKKHLRAVQEYLTPACAHAIRDESETLNSPHWM